MQTPCHIESISFVCVLAAAAQSSCELHPACTPVFPSVEDSGRCRIIGCWPGRQQLSARRRHPFFFRPHILQRSSDSQKRMFLRHAAGLYLQELCDRGILLIRDAIHAMINSIKDGPRRTPKLCLSRYTSYKVRAGRPMQVLSAIIYHAYIFRYNMFIYTSL